MGSAYKDDREEFDRIFEFIIQQKEKVAICCDKVDRLSRNMFDKRVFFLYDKALQDEIELNFISDGQVINSRISAAEKFHFGISLGLAKYYSDTISDNVKRVLEQKLHKGIGLTISILNFLTHTFFCFVAFFFLGLKVTQITFYYLIFNTSNSRYINITWTKL